MLLINPAQEKFGGFLSRYVPVGIPVALGCLAAALTKAGVAVKVVDEEITEVTPSRLRELVAGLEKPYVFGISCLTAHVVRGYALAKMLRREFPDCTIVFGGLHPTSLPGEALAHPEVDYVVRGEGEDTVVKLYRALRGDGDPRDLPGLSFRRDGEVVHNPDAALIPELDDIPLFPYELFAHPKYDMGFITTSRGCPYACTYCSQRMLTGTTYRYKSAQRIVEEVSLLADRYGQKAIVFYDDNFCFKKRRVLEVCDALIAAGLHQRVEFSIQTRADNFHADIVPRMAAAGFKHVGFGMETGVDRLADLIAKDETVQQHLDAVAVAKRYGMEVSLFMIYGLPTETRADREATYDLVQGQKVQASKYNNLIPYPGTPIFEDLKKTDRLRIAPGWSNFNSTLSVTRSIFDRTPLPYVPETTSEWELKRDIVRYNFRTYLKAEAVKGILLGRKGPGWYKLPRRWYLRPRELFHVTRIGFNALVNLTVANLPLRLTEPVMNALNPAMRERPRVRGYTSAQYRPTGWSLEQARARSFALNQAKHARKSGGAGILPLSALQRRARPPVAAASPTGVTPPLSGEE